MSAAQSTARVAVCERSVATTMRLISDPPPVCRPPRIPRDTWIDVVAGAGIGHVRGSRPALSSAAKERPRGTVLRGGLSMVQRRVEARVRDRADRCAVVLPLDARDRDVVRAHALRDRRKDLSDTTPKR